MKRYYVFVLLIAFVAIGCGPTQQTAAAETQIAEAWTPTPISTSTPSPTPTLTATPTPTPTHTVTPSITPTFPPLPNFLTLSIADQPVLSSSADPACQLPCWQGLTPGESTLADIQRVAREVFRFDEGRVNAMPGKFDEGLPHRSAAGVFHYRSGWLLEPSKEDSGYVAISFVIDKAETPQGIDISQLSAGEYYPVSTPQQIIEKLGSPDDVVIAIYRVGMERAGRFSLNLVYTDGISIRFIYEQMPTLEVENFIYIPVCLSTTPNSSHTYLVPPFDLTGQNVTTTQQEWIFNTLAWEQWGTVEEQLDMTIDEFVEFILQPDPCLDIDFNAAPFG